MANFSRLPQKWSYQSFRPVPEGGDNQPQIAAPWSPLASLTVTTDAQTGAVTGDLVFAPEFKLAVTGAVIPAAAGLPEGIELTAEGHGSINKLRGYFVDRAAGLIAGIVIAVKNDPAKQPDGTRGSFVLFPNVG